MNLGLTISEYNLTVALGVSYAKSDYVKQVLK
ncbi:hypothetical protein PR003_g31476 [Phytophthora rubi]|uniref:Uncharacterized protein n=1 Tax=Phytophthora rubi TaxID=129364 RepID=A0A6A3GJK5_9STRA|nr:hypothetical protein PR002_g30634 [Phytophthora rubi]KAE8960251.1 hypothetical protein PR001_g30444 [Phytophthora rubi]KAE9268358.1 hypothetical protein PR003_g31476 [Phytophthora rubi]